jgi:acyl dehydratase
MAIITEDTPIGYELPPISRKLDVGLNRVKTDDGEIDTIHTDPEAAAREGLEKPIAVGSRIFGVIPRMMMLCFEEGWIEGGKGSIVTRRPAGLDDLVTAKGVVTGKTPEGDDKLRVECEVWVETDKGEKVIVGQCSGLVPRSR